MEKDMKKIQRDFESKRRGNIFSEFFEVYEKVGAAIREELDKQLGEKGYDREFVLGHLEVLYEEAVGSFMKNDNVFYEQYPEIVKKFGILCRRDISFQLLSIRYQPIYELLRSSYAMVVAEKRERERNLEREMGERVRPFFKR